jgi:hypothetical protein
MSYTITECRKIGGEMTQYTQYIPPSVALNPIPENYLCGTGGVLL